MKRIGVNVWSWKLSRKQHCWGQQRYCPCKKKEKRDLGPMETCCYPLPRTINQAEHPSWVYHNHNHNHNHIHNHNNNNSNIAKNLKQHLETIGVTIKDELLQKVALLYLVDLFMNKLKTKFNNLFYRIILNTKRIHNSFWRNFPVRAKQTPSNVLFVAKKKRRPRPFGHCAPKL